MSDGQNLATRYAKKVDERFYRESQAVLALNNDYEFQGSQYVKVYSIPIVPMNDYSRSGSNRYGSPTDLSRNVQTLKISRDRSFTFIIDKGDKLQSEMVSDAGKALSRQLREVVVPEFDSYVFKTLADAAKSCGSYASTALDKTNAYAAFLAGMERLGDNNVPDKGRVAFCTYRFANLLKQDPAFMKYSDMSQEMLVKGVIGEVDGCKIVKVPSNHLPAGAAFILTHSVAAAGPKQLDEYKIHENSPGISGWLVEGRFIYDCFVLNEKAGAVYYHGGQSIIKSLNVVTAAGAAGKSTVIVNGVREGSRFCYVTAENAAGLAEPEFGTAVDNGVWTALAGSGTEISVPEGHTVIRVAELDGEDKPIAAGTAILNTGI